jgi:hypothetical protein
MRMDPETHAYVEKRTAQGRTTKEIRRSLKRYLARQIYRQLNAREHSCSGRLTNVGDSTGSSSCTAASPAGSATATTSDCGYS